jgi:paraquat-inducible protein A
VLVLSLTIFFIKTHGVWDAKSLNGVYFFTAAVVLMILAYAWLRADVLQVAEAENKPRTAPAHAATPPADRIAGPFSAPYERAGEVAATEADNPKRGRPQHVAEELGDEPTRRGNGLSTIRNVVLSFLIIVATVFFALGIILPAIKFTTVYVWKNEHSIASIIYALYTSKEYFLCVIIFVFSILFPFLKLFYLLTLVTSPDMPHAFRAKSISAMEWLGRYSMTDVMVLALIIFYVNSSGYTEARVQPGIWFFAASALMTMFAYGWANSVAPRRGTTIVRAVAAGPAEATSGTAAISAAAPQPQPQTRARPARV